MGLLFPLLLSLGSGAVIWLVLSSRPNVRRTKSWRFQLLFLSRFFVIESLQDHLEELPGGTADWRDICQDLLYALKQIESSVQQRITSPGMADEEFFDSTSDKASVRSCYAVRKTAVKEVVSVIDKELLRFLQTEPYLVDLFGGCIPKPGESWDAFLDEKLGFQKTIVDGLQPSKCMDLSSETNFMMDLMNGCLTSVRQIYATTKRLLEESTDTTDSLRSGPHEKHDTDLELVSDQAMSAPSRTDLEPPKQSYTVVKVFYATDRQVTPDGDYVGKPSRSRRKGSIESMSAASAQSLNILHYGVVEVGIPQTHAPGTIEIPDSGEDADPVKHIVILSYDTKLRGRRDKFVEMVKDDLVNDKTSEVLVFIHGYGVTHKEAMKRAAQLKFDLQFGGLVIAYSWSSRGDLYGYSEDERNVLKTVECLRDFLLMIATDVNAEKVHVLAHSMGNRALIRALKSLYEQRHPSTRAFSQLVFAAADEDRSKFEELLECIDHHETTASISSTNIISANGLDVGVGINDFDPSADDGRINCFSSSTSRPHLTVYSAINDAALFVSKVLHFGQLRLGDTRSLLKSKFEGAKLEDIHDLVDATGTDASFLSHSYYGDASVVIKDIATLVKQIKPAKHRPELHSIQLKGKRFYAFRKDKWRTQGHSTADDLVDTRQRCQGHRKDTQRREGGYSPNG